MDVSACRFETERLRVRPWVTVSREAKRALVAEALTPAATSELPPHWQAPIDDVDLWLDDRAEEAPALVSHDGGLVGFDGHEVLSNEVPPQPELRFERSRTDQRDPAGPDEGQRVVAFGRDHPAP